MIWTAIAKWLWKHKIFVVLVIAAFVVLALGYKLLAIITSMTALADLLRVQEEYWDEEERIRRRQAEEREQEIREEERDKARLQRDARREAEELGKDPQRLMEEAKRVIEDARKDLEE